MNTTSITLTIVSILTVSNSMMVIPVCAQERTGARFSFAPQVFKLEESYTPPRDYGKVDPHAVKTGSVPRGSSFLGVDPQLLSHPAPTVAPLAQTQVVARPSFTQIVPHTPAPFKAEFGKPINPALSLKPAKAANVLASKNVSGLLKNKKRAIGRSARPALANAGKGVDNYGANFGYVPGSYLPSTAGTGLSSNADVHGKLLKH